MEYYELTMYLIPNTTSSVNKTKSIGFALRYLFVHRTNNLNANIKYKYFNNFIIFPHYWDEK